MQSSQSKTPAQQERQQAKELLRLQQSSQPVPYQTTVEETAEEIQRHLQHQHQPGKVNPEALPEEEKEARASLNRSQRKKADRKFLKAQGKQRPRLKKLLRRKPR